MVKVQISFCIFFLHHLHLENPFHSTFRHWNSNCKPMAIQIQIQIQIQNHSHSVLNPQRSKLLIMPKLKEDWIITTHNFRSHIEVDGGIHKYETHLHLIIKKKRYVFLLHIISFPNWGKKVILLISIYNPFTIDNVIDD